MLKVGILEDEKVQSDIMESFLQKDHQMNSDFHYSVEVFETAEKLLNSDISGFEILFMDIQLPDMLGIDAARKIREINSKVMIVFVTNLTQYAIDGYSVNAYDYILKPLVYDAFKVKMDRFMNVLSHGKKQKILVLKTKQEIYHISADCIQYVEVAGHNLVFHTDEREIHLWGTLSKYENELEGTFFSRCNACYLVNLKYVQTIKGNTVIVANRELIISKTRRKEFLSDLARYKGGSS